MKLRANVLHRTGASTRPWVIDTNQVEAHLRRGVPFLVLPLGFHVEPLGRGLQPDRRGGVIISGSRSGSRMRGRIVVSVAAGRRRPCLGRNAIRMPSPRAAQSPGCPRATWRSISGMLIPGDQKTNFDNCDPRSCQPGRSFQMYRFVQIEKRAPAPLISVPSLKCSQSQGMPKCRFCRRPFLGSFGRRIRWGADHAVQLQISAWRKNGKASGQRVLTSSTQTIRKRLLEAGVSFAPNDNIAEHLRPGDIEVIQAEVERHMQAVLDALVIDTNRDHNSQGTAKRIAKMYVREVFAGRFEAPLGHGVSERQRPG